jgi:DNA-directed RNA polymerase subunit beta'
MSEVKRSKQVTIVGENMEERIYPIPYGARLKVAEGQAIEIGDELTEGAVNPHDILRIKGPGAVQNCLISGVQQVYRREAVDINDKHIEVIVRQMLRKVKVEDPGNTNLLMGALIDITEFEEENEKVTKRMEAGETNLRLAVFSPVLLGITKASLATSSFLSAASFQETTRVLTDAAIKGKVDPLLGLKENVIIGKLIPAGTGISLYRDVEIDTSGADEAI